MCKNDKNIKRGVIVNAKEVHTTIVESDDGTIVAGDEGAVLVHIEYIEGTFQGPYREMSDLAPVNVFPPPPAVPPEVSIMEFPFIKVQDLPWASSGCRYPLLSVINSIPTSISTFTSFDHMRTYESKGGGSSMHLRRMLTQ